MGVSYHDLTGCLVFLLQSLFNLAVKALKLQVGERQSVVTLHLQIG